MSTLRDNLGAPDKDVFIDTEQALHRYVPVNPAAAAAPVTPINIYGVQDVTPSAAAPKKTFEAMQQGGRGERRRVNLQYEYNVDVKILLAEAIDLVPAIFGQTWTLAGDVARPMVFPEIPVINLESVYRLVDGLTHAGSYVCPDLILKAWAPNFGADAGKTSLPFYSRFVPFILKAGAEMVYDVFTGDGSATGFALSATPLDMVDVATSDLDEVNWIFDNAVYVKRRAAGSDIAVLQTTGVQITGTALALTTAPAAGEKVEVYYAKATA